MAENIKFTLQINRGYIIILYFDSHYVYDYI